MPLNKNYFRLIMAVITVIAAIAFFDTSAFACRLLSIVTNKMENPVYSQLTRELFYKNPASLKAQSDTNLENKKNRTLTLEDLHNFYEKDGNPDGWGMVGYRNAQIIPEKYRSKQSAYKDVSFNESVDSLIANNADIILGHVRWASIKSTVTEDNTHPFTYNNWSFMHNGYVNTDESPFLRDKLAEFKNKYGLYPTGIVDSEWVFYYFLGLLKQKEDTLNRQSLTADEKLETFAEAVINIKNSTKSFVETFKNELTGENYGYRAAYPSMNFITSDGKDVFAYRKGHDLYLGIVNKTTEEHYYILSSEIIRPPQDMATIEWYIIPDNYFVHISPEHDSFKFYPIEYFQEKKHAKADL